VHLTAPGISTVIEYCASSPMVAVDMSSFDIMLPTTASAPVRAAIEFTVKPLNWDVIGSVIDVMLYRQTQPLTLTVHGRHPAPGVNFASTLLTDIDIDFDMPCLGNLSLSESSFDYELEDTTPFSASFKAFLRTGLTIPVLLDLGDVSALLFYKDVPIATFESRVVVGPGLPLSLDMSVKLVGQNNAPDTHVDVPVHPRLSVLNEFLSDVVENAFKKGGTRAQMKFSFVGKRGEREAILDLLLFEKQLQRTIENFENIPAAVIELFTIDMTEAEDSHGGDVHIPALAVLSDPIDLPLQIGHISLTLKIRDRNGVEYVSTSYSCLV
jgi:hypothetical protein